MSRYFFEVLDGERSTPDEEGLELSDLHAAKRAAIAALTDLARDELPNGDPRVFTIQVRDGAGTRLLTVRLALSIA